METVRDRPAPAPVPGSLTWRYFGDWRGSLLATRAGTLQAMHPTIGAILDHTGDFAGNQWNRLLRSAGPILRTVYSVEHADEVSGWVRDQHRGMVTRDEHGKVHHGLDPDAYYWAHATFFEGQIETQRQFGRPLSRVIRERLYDESIGWWERYGLTMRPVPATYAEFERYFASMIEDELVLTEPVRLAYEAPVREQPVPLEGMPAPVWWALRPAMIVGNRRLAAATLPAPLTGRIGLHVGATERAAFEAGRVAVRQAFELLPWQLRYMPIARSAFVRTGVRPDGTLKRSRGAAAAA